MGLSKIFFSAFFSSESENNVQSCLVSLLIFLSPLLLTFDAAVWETLLVFSFDISHLWDFISVSLFLFLIAVELVLLDIPLVGGFIGSTILWLVPFFFSSIFDKFWFLVILLLAVPPRMDLLSLLLALLMILPAFDAAEVDIVDGFAWAYFV